MKKCVIISKCLVIASILVYICISVFLIIKSHNIEVKEDILLGSKEEAYDVHMNFQGEVNHKILWNTDMFINKDNKINSQIKLHYNSFKGNEDMNNYVDFGNSFSSIISSNSIDKEFLSSYNRRIYAPVWKIAEKMSALETVEKTIYMKDYFDHLPIGIDVNIKSDSNTTEMELHQLDLTDVYKIPIAEDFKLKYTVTKGEENKITQIGVETVGDNYEPNLEPNYEPNCKALIVKDNAYLSVNSYNEKKYKLEKIPIKYKNKNLSNDVYLDYKNIEYSHEFLQDSNIISMKKSNDNKFIYVFLKTKKSLELLKLNSSDLNEVDRVKLFTSSKNVYVNFYLEKDDFIAAYISSGNDKRIALIEKNEKLDLALCANANKALTPNINDNQWMQNWDIAWDGEKMAFLSTYQDMNITYLSVYNKEGILYLGKYVYPNIEKFTPWELKNPVSVKFS